MKTRLFIIALLTLVFGLTGCKHHLTDYDSGYDYTPPAPPTNVSVLAGDEQVTIYWDRNRESDVAGYNIYYSFEYDGKYSNIGNTKNTFYVDGGSKGPENGTKYYYAVKAYDYDGNESDFSSTYVYGIPRPEGYNFSIFDFRVNPSLGGFGFADYKTYPYDHSNTDFFFDKDQNRYYLDVWTDTEIKDMGLTNDISEVTLAPVSGYATLIPGETYKYVEAIAGHTYIIKTVDNHFAKVRIKQITSDKVIFDWAYQLLANERMLKQGNVTVRTTNRTEISAHRK